MGRNGLLVKGGEALEKRNSHCGLFLISVFGFVQEEKKERGP